ncbi:MAG TPA: hypothetical protein VFQ82_02360, partial [Stellaceae bacterium]|nr:hypothetical protein [Stellaceae bacterium]
RSWFLPVALVAISAVGSWEFACITPFVAFAVAAGHALSAQTALLTVTAIWCPEPEVHSIAERWLGCADQVRA